MRLAGLAILAGLLLTACGSVPVPEITWYRLPEPVLPSARNLRLDIPVDVAVFGADGLYADQALIYVVSDEGQALRSYHYQQWSDPPSRMLQRRLIQVLRAIEAAPLVTDRLPASADAWRVSGTIQRLDRVRRADNYFAEVALQMRVEKAGRLVFEQVYKAEASAEDAQIEATVRAFAKALDEINAAFIAQLAAQEPS